MRYESDLFHHFKLGNEAQFNQIDGFGSKPHSSIILIGQAIREKLIKNVPILIYLLLIKCSFSRLPLIRSVSRN